MPKPPILGRQRRTNPVVWCFAVVCSLIATIIIITGIVLFSGYLIIRPKMPLLLVSESRLVNSSYHNSARVLYVKLIIKIRAENYNQKSQASFYNTKLLLGYHGVNIAKLVANPFDVPKNESFEFTYVVESSPVPLTPEQRYLTEKSLRDGKMLFVLKGSSRTMWKVGPLGSVKFSLHMYCELRLPVNGSTLHSHCSTRSH